MNYPIEIRNAIPPRPWIRLQNHLDNEPWLRNNVDYSPNNGVSWSQLDEQTPVYYDIGVILSFRLKKVIKGDLSIVKIHVNGQTMGQMSTFHKDSSWDDVWTVVLFTAPSWDTNFGGEFTVYCPDVGTYRSVSYIPNTAVAFPANWEHRGAPPLHPDAGFRTSLAVTFCRPQILDGFLEAHPVLQGFSNYPKR